MAIEEVSGQPWTRKHDNPDIPVVPRSMDGNAPRTLYPKSLEQLIEICSTREPSQRIRAAGSHWALSEAAISDEVFVETHDPRNMHQALGRTLYDVVPGCLSEQFITALASKHPAPFNGEIVAENEGLYPVHIETGKRVYQLYAELDSGDDDPRSLAELLSKDVGSQNRPWAVPKNSDYLGSWAFRTLGGAGGQTVFGALTTGTHGSDFRIPPIADSVMALHLVADGGKHYWIEPESPTPLGARLTADEPLKALYGQPRYGGPNNFEIIRDDNVFNAVLISAGRFGIVYSIVIAAVRQYCLYQERRLTTWQEIKDQIKDPESALYTERTDKAKPPMRPRSLQIAINVTPHEHFTKNLAGITKQWKVPLRTIPQTAPPDFRGKVRGRPERRGDKGPFDSAIQARRFSRAGNSRTYSPAGPDRPGEVLPPSLIERACSSSNFMEGVIQTVITDIETFINSGGRVAPPSIVAVTAAGVGAALLPVLVALLGPILPLLVGLLAAISSNGQRFGQTMNNVKDTLLSQGAGGIFAWHAIAYEAFKDQQKERDFEAISYAVMDGHDYFDISCQVNADSIEVFFDATDDKLIAYVNALLIYEAAQEVTAGKGMIGYISLRFTGPTRALIGQQRFERTCAVEVSGLRDAEGSTELIDFATNLALNNNVKGILHWGQRCGQRNESLIDYVEERFGNDIYMWREALSRITDHGKLDGFSSEFTRRTGLEIVNPIIGSLSASGSALSMLITIDWDCDQNPPLWTTVRLEVINLTSGSETPIDGDLPLAGQRQVPVTEYGEYSVSLYATIELDGQRREAAQNVRVTIVSPIG
jgi:hypothetical protein